MTGMKLAVYAFLSLALCLNVANADGANLGNIHSEVADQIYNKLPVSDMESLNAVLSQQLMREQRKILHFRPPKTFDKA